MPWFPVIAAEVEDAERRLGIALPPSYKARLLDARIARLLSHPVAGTFRDGMTMLDFVALTEEMRAAHPDFPRDGVVANAVFDHVGHVPQFNRGYWRFWLPDPNAEGVLGTTLYAWDAATGKRTKDTSSDRWIDSILEVVFASDSSLFSALGVAAPRRRARREKVTVRPGDAAVSEQLSRQHSPGEVASLDAARWWSCGTLEVRGEELSVCDLAEGAGDGSQVVRVAPGRYEVTVQLGASIAEGWLVVRAMRCVAHGATCDARVHAFDVPVDSAAIVVCDRQPLMRALRPGDREAAFEELESRAPRPSVAVLASGVEVLVMPSGDGDGSYRVCQLLQGGEPVGLEVDFPA